MPALFQAALVMTIIINTIVGLMLLFIVWVVWTGNTHVLTGLPEKAPGVGKMTEKTAFLPAKSDPASDPAGDGNNPAAAPGADAAGLSA